MSLIARRPSAGEARARRARALEALEPQMLLATLPPPLVAGRTNISNPLEAASGTNESSPAIAVSPNDPRKLVAVWTEGVGIPDDTTPINTRGDCSTDGGETWTPLGLPQTVFDPSLPPDSSERLTRAMDATVAFDRLDAFYGVNSQQFAGAT